MTTCEYCGAPSEAIDREREKIKKILLGHQSKIRMYVDLNIDGIRVRHLQTFNDARQYTRFQAVLPMGEFENVLPVPENHRATIEISLIPYQE